MAMSHGLWAACVGIVLSLAGAYPEEPSLQSKLGRTDKFRILVDKVMQPEAGWKTEEWMVRETAEAGFNVFSPRIGHEDLDAVRRVTEWCAKYRVCHMPWMRGSLGVTLEDPVAAGHRMVWENGTEQPLYSPNADAFWEWTERYVVEYAKLSVENQALIGVFLDYENYAPDAQGNLYGLSYDTAILDEFARTVSIELPSLEPVKRKAWLVERGLHERFSAFQIGRWRERCRAVRQAVDAINPRFQFCVYPAPGTPFMVEAIYHEWATQEAPLILADASTYGRSSRFIPEPESLAKKRACLQQNIEIPKQANIPFLYTGGIDPVVPGADPEYCGKNAVMISEATAGYWIFYEGPTYTKQDHKEYWKWFTWANRKIAQGQFDAQNQPRETTEGWFNEVFDRVKGEPAVACAQAANEKVSYPPARLRGANLLIVAGKKGAPVEVVLKHVPVSNYVSTLMWETRGPDARVIAQGTISQDQSGTVTFTPDKDGLCLLAVSADSCAYSVVSSTMPLAIYVGENASFIGPVPKLYFQVPKDVTEFAVKAKASPRETVRVNVFNAQAEPVAAGQTTAGQTSLDIPIRVENGKEGVWSLETARAEQGVIEDYTLSFEGKLPPCMSLDARHVLTAREEK